MMTRRKGGWIYDKKDTIIVPYHLPEIIKASEVIVVEGEKDADCLTYLGFTATTNPFGAGNWPEDFGKYFKGKEVVMIPDNDNPGRRHMDKVAANLQGHAAFIRLLDLPDLTEKRTFLTSSQNFPIKKKRPKNWLT